MTDKTTAEREAFEAWLPKSWSRATTTDDEGDESYKDDWVQGAWVGFREARASLPMPGAQEAVAWAMFADNGNIRLWSKKPIPHPDAIPLYAAPQPAAPYSMDADPQGIRATVADAITGALAFGAQGVNRPPEGHWLAPFWNAAREDMAAPQPALSAGWVSVKDRLPPCRDDQDYIGINSAGFAGIFNAVADIAGNVYCMMETAEESVSIMSDLSIWKPFTRPLPVEPSMDGEGK